MKKIKILICILFCCISINLFATDHIIINDEQTYSNQTFKNYLQAGSGGVFYVTSEGNLTLNSNISFFTNSATSFNFRGYGGSIYNDSGTVTIESTIFESNSASGSGTATASAKSASGIGYGGSIYNNNGTITIESTKFCFNEATGFVSVNIPYGQGISYGIGGAIVNTKGGTIIVSSTTFESNSASASGYHGSYGYGYQGFGYGGAVYNYGTMIFNTTIFESNSASGSADGFSSYGGSGGAIYTFQYSTTTFMDGVKFINNEAQTQGGAIYNSGGIINLIANTNDIEFTGNTANGTSNAIHNGGIINLWTSENASVTFNDRITGSGTININYSTATLNAVGKIILNEIMSGYTGPVNLYNGEIELQSKTNGNNINTNKFFSGDINLSGGTLNILNNAIDNITVSTLTVTSNASLKFDVDLSNNTSDNFTVTNNVTGTLNLTAINILGVNENSGQITLFNNSKSPTVNILTTGNYGGYEYIFTNNDGIGVLNYEKGDEINLKDTINKNFPPVKSYSLVANENVTEDLGILEGAQLTIFGNAKDIIGSNVNGIYVANDKILNIQNINNYSGFNSTYAAIKNEGTLNISGTKLVVMKDKI